MQPQHVTLDISSPRDPRMERYVELMGWNACQSTVVFSASFFNCFWRQIVAIDEYAYAGVDFRGDPNLVLPEGAQWGAIDKNDLTMFFLFF